jgi:integrase/recombinase XerC
MSSVFSRSGIYYAKVRTSSGTWIARTCETRDRALGKSIGRMVDELAHRGKQSWDLLDAVARGGLSLPTLYAAYSMGRLDELRDRMNDVDLSPIVDEWLESLRGRLAPDTIEHYRVHIRTLFPVGKRFPRSALTFERLSEWLSKIQRSSGTRRKYHAAMNGFCRYLRARGVVRNNPLQDVRAPRPGAPRCRSIEHHEVLQIVDALEDPYRTVVALMHSTGMELSVALSLKRRDVDFERGEIRARGTKTKARNRVVTIEPWGAEYLREYARRFLPNALLFPDLNRWTVSDKHRQACTALEFEDYQLRDSRHTYAVRAIRAGASFEAVARQLGHANTAMVAQVYGRYEPTDKERRDWHRVAEAQDSLRAAK